MCGLAGFASLDGRPVPQAHRLLSAMNNLIAHRGPDGEGRWLNSDHTAGLAHRRLAIIELTEAGAQPMRGDSGLTITFNGEIYNYIELQRAWAASYPYRTRSDCESILAAYALHGRGAPSQLRGMFAFAVWDEKNRLLFAARDRFGIKPFYYTIQNGVLYFASEIKALTPTLPAIETDRKGLSEYVVFQYPITDRTLLKGVRQLPPGHSLTVQNGRVIIDKYWDVQYVHDHTLTAPQAVEKLRALMADSMDVHLRADVPVGAYLSGGVDSSLVALMAAERSHAPILAFHGKFTCAPGYDESRFAALAAARGGMELHQIDITAQHFTDHIADVIYHLDQPVAGPGSFPQYMVSQLAAKHRKVVLGGQGGDEIFGGYARYMVGYLERALAAALDPEAGSPPLSITDIAPNLATLREYKPLIQQLFSKGMFGPLDQRFKVLCDRSGDFADEVDWEHLDLDHVWNAYSDTFNDRAVVPEGQDLDAMTHWDFRRLLPALLQVEDRMSMAHGLESRVPFLDEGIVEFAAALPTIVKYEGGKLKHMLRAAFEDSLPAEIFARRDKMGFPVPLKEWWTGDLRDYVHDVFGSRVAGARPFIRADKVLSNFDTGAQFSRKTWALLSLELWHRNFHDRAAELRTLDVLSA